MVAFVRCIIIASDIHLWLAVCQKPESKVSKRNYPWYAWKMAKTITNLHKSRSTSLEVMHIAWATTSLGGIEAVSSFRGWIRAKNGVHENEKGADWWKLKPVAFGYSNWNGIVIETIEMFWVMNDLLCQAHERFRIPSVRFIWRHVVSWRHDNICLLRKKVVYKDLFKKPAAKNT